ncbi:hypothetical protein GJ496_009340 [Pomphorhynchus laevis]|nr:hypothetical protein GJ496_009340 [Pomphorhynchus laevis]
MAQLHSASYSQSQSLGDVQINVVYADDEGREQNNSTNDPAVLAATTKQCNGCGKVEHFSKACRSKPKQKSRINMIDTHHKDSRLTTVLLKSMAGQLYILIIMKCAIIHPDFGLGGAERLILDEAIALKQSKHDIDIFTTNYNPEHAFDETKRFTIYSIGQSLPRTIFGYGYILICWIRMILVCLYMILNNMNYDIIFVDQVSVIVPLLRLKYKHVIFYCHFPDHLLASHSNLIRQIYRYPFDLIEELSLIFATVILANSEFTKSTMTKVFPNLRNYYDDDLSNVQILYPCIHSIKDTSAEMTEANGSDEILQFVSLNRYERKKNIELSIKATSHFAKICNAKFQLTIAGGYDERLPDCVQYYNELVNLAKKLNVDALFMRSISDKEKDTLFRKATCVIYTPADEHFGIVPIDAMSYGKPVLAVNSGGPCETIVHGKTGFLIEQDPEAFAMRMKSLAENKELRLQMGEAGEKRVRDLYSFEKFRESLNGLVIKLN